MDQQKFDNLTRLAATASRRQVLRTLAGAVGSGLFALVGVRAAGSGAQPLPPSGAGRPCTSNAQCGCGSCVFPPNVPGLASNIGHCVPFPSKCGPCERCDPDTLECVSNNSKGPCEACGRCDDGICRPDDAQCPGCRFCDDVEIDCGGVRPDDTPCDRCMECSNGRCVSCEERGKECCKKTGECGPAGDPCGCPDDRSAQGGLRPQRIDSGIAAVLPPPDEEPC